MCKITYPCISRLKLLQSTLVLGGSWKRPDNPACTRTVSPQTQEAGYYTEEEEEESACNILCLPVMMKDVTG